MAKKRSGSLSRRELVKVLRGGVIAAAAGPTILVPSRAWAQGTGPIRIGNIEPLSGPHADSGLDEMEGAFSPMRSGTPREASLDARSR